MRVEAILAVVGLCLVLQAVSVAGAGQATVQAPVEASGIVTEGQGGSLVLADGKASILVAEPVGNVKVWSYRVPCLQESPSSCFASNGAEEQRTIDITGGSVSIVPVDGEAFHAHLQLADDSVLGLEGQTADLDVRSENRTHSFFTEGQAPDTFNDLTLAKGVKATFPSGVDVDVQGGYVLSAVNATYVVVDRDGQEQRIQSGWTWEQQNGVTYHRLTLVNVQNTGQLSIPWEGTARVSPPLPLGVSMEEATLTVASGSLSGVPSDGASQAVSDLSLTLIDAQPGQDGGQATFTVEQGLPAPPEPTEQDEDALSGTALLGTSAMLAAGLGLVAYYWPRVSWTATVLALPMYSRIEKSELLDNETREQLYEAVKDEPGIHAHALSEAVEIGWGTTVYHLRRLERNGMVTSERRGRYRRFFPAAGYMARTREVLSVLQNETTNDIARYILKNPGTNQKGICEALDISPSLANWHINRLMDAELVERERRGRTVHYTPGQAWDAIGDDIEMPVS